LSASALEKRIRKGLLEINGIVDVYFRTELLDKKTPDRPYLTRYRNSYSSSRGEDFKLRYVENAMVTRDSLGSEHGSPYHYDTHVPIVFWGPKFRANRITTPTHTVDIAPTIARFLSVPIPKSVDGTILRDVVN
jgi:arylsulfatase A-like enzyme